LRLKRSKSTSILTQSAIRNPQSAIFLLIPALGYFAIALTTDINLGYRHILPVLPFLIVFTAVSLSQSSFTLRISSFAVRPATLLVLWLTAVSLWIHPHFLAYFNVLAGGPNGGWRYLVDSNLDWGQDLGGLQQWLDENGIDHVWLSYFGEGRPEYYDIHYTGLDSWPPRLMDPEARPFYPHDPAPGYYAISATTLQGVQFTNHDEFAWFRDKEPLAKIGYSIFIYNVPAHGEPVDLALGGVQIDELVPADFAQLHSNDLTLSWFDPQQALLLPQSDNRWVALPASPTLADAWDVTADWELAAQTAVYRLYRLPPQDDGRFPPQAEFMANGGTIALLAGQLAETAVPGQPFTFTTRWYKTSTPEPLQLFVHLTDANGQIVVQWDGLGAKWSGWRAQTVLWQAHTLPLPADLPPGVYDLRIGLYNPVDGRRLLTSDGADYVVLGQLALTD